MNGEDESMDFEVLAGSYLVMNLPNADIHRAAWWVSRELRNKAQDKLMSTGAFNYTLMDSDGLHVVCDPVCAASLQSLNIESLVVSPMYWKAVHVNITGGSTSDGASCVSLLATKLAEKDISTLHISTFESEIFMVHETALHATLDVFETVDSGPGLDSSVDNVGGEEGTSGNSEQQQDGAVPVKKSRHALQLMPRDMYLSRLNNEAPFDICMDTFVEMFLHDPRFCKLERQARLYRSKAQSLRREDSQEALSSLDVGDGEMEEDVPPFLWGVWTVHGETTLLLEEEDIDRMPEGSLVVSPQRWRTIKLSGPTIGFDEAGILHGMSDLPPEIPVLNISTVLTNCTLVPEENLDQALDQITRNMSVTVMK
jgi:hypothetical protein